jgi:hypothetical protein
VVAIDVDKDTNVDGEYSEQNTNQGHCRESVDHFDSEKHQGTHAYEWKKKFNNNYKHINTLTCIISVQQVLLIFKKVVTYTY